MFAGLVVLFLSSLSISTQLPHYSAHASRLLSNEKIGQQQLTDRLEAYQLRQQHRNDYLSTPPPGTTPSPLCTACRATFNKKALDGPMGNITWSMVDWALEEICSSLTLKDDHQLCYDAVSFIMDDFHHHQHDWIVNMSEYMCGSIVPICPIPCCKTRSVPEQVHLSFSLEKNDEPREQGSAEEIEEDVLLSKSMKASWITYDLHWYPFLDFWYTKNLSNKRSTYSSTSIIMKRRVTLVEKNTDFAAGWRGWIYSAIMYDLPHDTEIYYQMGNLVPTSMEPDSDSLSKVFSFRTLPLDVGQPHRPLRLINFADMGVGGTHQETIDAIRAKVTAGKVDLILHYGDISYADGDFYRWDRFMQDLQDGMGISQVPYMVVPGNHELDYNFSAYKNRFFNQPKAGRGAPSDALYYTFTIGPHLRFIMLDSESHNDLPTFKQPQLDWLTSVLSEASSKKQFIVVGLHRPVYCTTVGGESCFSHGVLIRSKLENLLYSSNVSVVYTGHVHNYERIHSTYNGTVQPHDSNKSNSTTAPVYLVIGNPGCPEGLHTFGTWPENQGVRPAFSAHRARETGYNSNEITLWPSTAVPGAMHFFSKIEEISSRNGTLIDAVNVTKVL